MTSDTWISTSVDGKQEDWLPLLHIGASGTAIGVSRQGAWYVGDAQECIPAASTKAGMRMLPLLDREVRTYRIEVAEALARHNMAIDRVCEGVEFPLLVAVATALKGPSEYWADLALARLEILQSTPEILELLQDLSKAKWASQRSRHRANKILRREQ